MRRNAAGFTLLEMMLAMVILAMVTMICYSAFFVAMRAVTKGEVAVVTAQRLRVATDVLIRQVKSAVPYAARNEDEEIYPFFQGDGMGFAFVTANGRIGGGGMAHVRYAVAGDPPQLTLEESPLFSPDELGGEAFDPGGQYGAVLLTGFKTATFQYLLDDGADIEWRDVWDGYEEDMLPKAVRIIIEGLPGLELDVWGQEIPLMVTSYGEANGEVDDTDLPDEEFDEEFDGDDDDDDDGGNA